MSARFAPPGLYIPPPPPLQPTTSTHHHSAAAVDPPVSRKRRRLRVRDEVLPKLYGLDRNSAVGQSGTTGRSHAGTPNTSCGDGAAGSSAGAPTLLEHLQETFPGVSGGVLRDGDGTDYRDMLTTSLAAVENTTASVRCPPSGWHLSVARLPSCACHADATVATITNTHYHHRCVTAQLPPTLMLVLLLPSQLPSPLVVAAAACVSLRVALNFMSTHVSRTDT
jgi:hypothetical protein